MGYFEAFLIGLVQGLTEFLPISSSAHLVIVPEMAGYGSPPVEVDIAVHLATLLAVVTYFARDLWGLIKGIGTTEGRRVLGLLALATLPAAILGFLLEDFFEDLADDPTSAAAQLLVNAGILFVAERWSRPTFPHDISNALNVPIAATVGAAQAVSILPGISRSGATISAGMLLGLPRDTAARFSFLLSIPIIAGTVAAKSPDLLNSEQVTSGPGLVAFGTAAVVGFVAIWGLLRLLRTRTLYPFAWYCVVFGVFSIVWFAVT